MFNCSNVHGQFLEHGACFSKLKDLWAQWSQNTVLEEKRDLSGLCFFSLEFSSAFLTPTSHPPWFCASSTLPQFYKMPILSKSPKLPGPQQRIVAATYGTVTKANVQVYQWGLHERYQSESDLKGTECWVEAFILKEFTQQIHQFTNYPHVYQLRATACP